MTRVIWGQSGQRFYETGVDRGMLYVAGEFGVPWNGLTGVSESPSGGEGQAFYVDGYKYLNASTAEEYEATITAFSSPALFDRCIGMGNIHFGLFIDQQRRESFDFSYRTLVGNDIEGRDYGYKLHLVYGALAAPSSRENASIGESVDPLSLSWSITTKPPRATEYRPTAHMVIDSSMTPPKMMATIEDILYGSEDSEPRMPSQDELIAIFRSNGPLIARNLFYNPSFEAGSGTVEIHRNLIINPSFESPGTPVEIRRNLSQNPRQVSGGSTSEALIRYGGQWGTSWASSIDGPIPGITTCFSATAITETSGAGRGFDWYGNPDVPAPLSSWAGPVVSPGQRITIRVWGRSNREMPSMGIGVRFYNADTLSWVGSLDTVKVGAKADEWTPISISRTVPAGATRFAVRGISNIDGMSFHMGDTLEQTGLYIGINDEGPYFDGSLQQFPDPDLTAAWSGPINSSASVLTGIGVASKVDTSGQTVSYRTKDTPWHGEAASRSIILTTGAVGMSPQRILPTPENYYTILMRVRPMDRDLRARPRIRATNGPLITFPKGVWTEVRFTDKAGTGSDLQTGLILDSGSYQVGDRVDLDAFALVSGGYTGPWFDGNNSPETDFTAAWSGAANASESYLLGSRVSLPTSPTTVKPFLSKQWAASGAKSLRVSPNYPVVGSGYIDLAWVDGGWHRLERGKTYTAFVTVRKDRPSLDFGRGGLLYVSEDPSTRKTAWAGVEAGSHDLRITFTVGPTGYGFLRLYHSGKFGEPDIWFDNVAIIEGEYNGPWFDGDTVMEGRLFRWTGERNNSPSEWYSWYD